MFKRARIVSNGSHFALRRGWPWRREFYDPIVRRWVRGEYAFIQPRIWMHHEEAILWRGLVNA